MSPSQADEKYTLFLFLFAGKFACLKIQVPQNENKNQISREKNKTISQRLGRGSKDMCAKFQGLSPKHGVDIEL